MKMDIFGSLTDLASGVGESLQGGVEGASDALDPAQLGDAATSVTDGVAQTAQDALDSLNPFN